MKVIRDVINRATGRITTRRIRRSRRSKVGGSMYKSKGKGFALKNNTNEVIYNTYQGVGQIKVRKVILNNNAYSSPANVGIVYSNEDIFTNCPDQLNFLATFGMYKIDKMVYTYKLVATSGNNAVIYHAKRPNSTLAPANLAALGEVPFLHKVILTKDNPSFTVSVVPFNATDVYISGTVNGYTKTHTWLELTTNSSNTPYYSSFFYIESMTTGDSITRDIEYMVSLKQPK